MEKVEIESFTLDHTKVKAPYVRLISEEKDRMEISYRILTFVCVNQIDKKFQPELCIHQNIYSHCICVQGFQVLDCSPFGCRTGFHLLAWGKHSSEDVAIAVKEALELITTTEWENVPGTEEKECGNYKDHSLFGAKEWAKEILEKGMSSDPFERKIV